MKVNPPKGPEEQDKINTVGSPQPGGRRPATPKEQRNQRAAELVELTRAMQGQNEEEEDTQEPDEDTARPDEEPGDEIDELFMADEQRMLNNLYPPLRRMLNHEVRESLKEELPRMTTGDVIMAIAEQTVPVIPDTLDATFRVCSYEEELHIGSLDLAGQNQKYVLDSINLERLTVMLQELGEDKLPEIRRKDGSLDRTALNSKRKRIRQLSTQIHFLLNAHLRWFEQRCYDTLSAEPLKNG